MARSVVVTLVLVSGVASHAYAVEAVKHIPAEYESTSALGTAMNNAGYAANDSHAAIRANPALLALEKEYSVSAGFHWPESGRDYYQASVVDSKTSSLAAGASYTGYTEDYVQPREQNQQLKGDSPLIRRGVIGLSQLFGQAAFGIGATYVEANALPSSEQAQRGEEKVRGFGLNLGAALALSEQLRLGASAENLSNRKIDDYAPKTYRGGVAYGFTKGVTGYLDYRLRERVSEFEGGEISLDAADETDKGLDKPEQMVIASLSAQVQDFLRLIGSYGQGLSDDRRTLAGGVAIVNKNFSLSYTASRPYMAQASTHQAVSLAIDLAL